MDQSGRHAPYAVPIRLPAISEVDYSCNAAHILSPSCE